MSTWDVRDGVRWRRHDASTFEFLPTSPDAERGPDGRPQVTLTLLGDQALLAVGARWDPPADRLEALRETLAAENETSPASVILSPPPLAMDGADLMLGDGHDDPDHTGFEVIATNPTAGFAPYAAVFSAVLSATDGVRVGSALHGNRGWLAVRYRAELDGEPLELWADLGDWFSGPPGAENVRIAPGTAVPDAGDDKPLDVRQDTRGS